jgi:hypothetical protein
LNVGDVLFGIAGWEREGDEEFCGGEVGMIDVWVGIV